MCRMQCYIGLITVHGMLTLNNRLPENVAEPEQPHFSVYTDSVQVPSGLHTIEHFSSVCPRPAFSQGPVASYPCAPLFSKTAAMTMARDAKMYYANLTKSEGSHLLLDEEFQ